MLLPETLRVHDRASFEFKYVYFLPHKGQVAEDLRELDSEVVCLGGSNNLAIMTRLPALIELMKDWKPDLIHCHLPIAGVLARLAGQITGTPVVYTEHNKQERYHFVTRRLNLTTLTMCKMVIGCSGDVTESISRHITLRNTELISLLNGVNTQRFDRTDFAHLRGELGVPTDKVVVGTVCVFRTQKRLHLWLDLARRLLRERPNLYFIVVGDGPEEDRLRGLATEYELDSVIQFPGRIQEVRPWLAAMDIYLMTSEFEGLPIAMLEAMSMELPVVATRAGGIGEAVTSGETGYLEEVDDWGKLFGHVKRLADQPELRARIGCQARQRVQKDFSVDRMARQLEAIYRRFTTP